MSILIWTRVYFQLSKRGGKLSEEAWRMGMKQQDAYNVSPAASSEKMIPRRVEAKANA